MFCLEMKVLKLSDINVGQETNKLIVKLYLLYITIPILVCRVLHGVIHGVPDKEDHSHEHVFLGEYATNVLNMAPKELEDMLFWLVGTDAVQTQGNIILDLNLILSYCTSQTYLYY